MGLDRTNRFRDGATEVYSSPDMLRTALETQARTIQNSALYRLYDRIGDVGSYLKNAVKKHP